MHDYIFVVENPLEWHRCNRQLNPGHYAVGPWWDGWLQAAGGAIYYLTDVSLPGGVGGRLKYGVIGLKAFLDELCQWRQLYVAGRLHKPVVSLKRATDAILNALKVNRSQALRTALLTLPKHFTGRALLERIVSLSYWGDWRMGWAEDPQKVARIVMGQGTSLWELYQRLLKDHHVNGKEALFLARPSSESVNHGLAGVSPDDSPLTLSTLDRLLEVVLEQDISPIGRLCELSKLPKGLRERLIQQHGNIYFLTRDPTPTAVPRAIKRAVASLVRPASIVQPCKGLLTAGLGKSLAYGIHKIKRRLF